MLNKFMEAFGHVLQIVPLFVDISTISWWWLLLTLVVKYGSATWDAGKKEITNFRQRDEEE